MLVQSRLPALSLRQRWMAAAATGVALNWVQGLNPWWPVAWFAPVPLLVAVYAAASFREACRLALAAGVLGLISNVVPSASDLAAPMLELVVVTLVNVPPFAVPPVVMMLIWRVAVGDARKWHAPLVFPAVAAAVDFGFTSISWHGTWGSWANSQMDLLPVIQTAAVGGTPAVVFLITLPASTAAIALVRRRAVALPGLAYGLPILLVAAALAYGVARLSTTPAMPRIAIGLVAADAADVFPPNAGEPDDATLAAYLSAATKLAEAEAQIVVLPEKLEIVEVSAASRIRDRLSGWSRDRRRYLLAGFGVVAPEYRDNLAWLFDRDGERIADYAKQHLVPLAEWRFRRGEQDAVVSIDGHTFGVAICKDMDFPRLSRRYGRAGIEAMLVPAWNFTDDGVYHARMAVLRGVEQGFAVIRTANQGMLTVSDPYGRIVAETASASAPVATMTTLAPLGNFRTPYRDIGDTFAWVSVGLVGLITVLAVREPTRGL